MLIHQEKIELTTSTGTAAINTDNVRGICHQIVVSPLSSSNTYNISITNPDSILVYERTSETGLLSELITLPMRGIYTVTISSSTIDEIFHIHIIIEE